MKEQRMKAALFTSNFNLKKAPFFHTRSLNFDFKYLVSLGKLLCDTRQQLHLRSTFSIWQLVNCSSKDLFASNHQLTQNQKTLDLVSIHE